MKEETILPTPNDGQWIESMCLRKRVTLKFQFNWDAEPCVKYVIHMKGGRIKYPTLNTPAQNTQDWKNNTNK